MKRIAPTTALAGLLLGSVASLLTPTASSAASVWTTGRASALPGAVQANPTGDSEFATVSGNGRSIVFQSAARLVPGDTDLASDVYVKDLLTDGLERISETKGGVPTDYGSGAGAISADGRFVVFRSSSSKLVDGDTNGKTDVFLRDRKTHTTERVSVSSTEVEGNGMSPSDHDEQAMDVSDDGRFVAFSSTSTNLGPDGDAASDIFVRDRQAGTTTLVSVSDGEAAGNGQSWGVSMSADGHALAFDSTSTDLVASDTNDVRDVFVRNRVAGTTVRVSTHDNETQSPSISYDPSIDASGTKVAFATDAKLNAIDPNSTSDVYVRDLTASTTTVASVGTNGWAAGESDQGAISGNGSAVAFRSSSAAAGTGANGYDHIYLRTNATVRMTVSTAGTTVSGDSWGPSLSNDATVTAFNSLSNSLVTNDTGNQDVFWRRQVNLGAFDSPTSYTSYSLGSFTGSALTDAINAMVAAQKNGASPEHAIVELANTPAFAGKRPALVRLYAAYFNRLPDIGGLNYWVGKLQNGTKLDKVSAQFAASSEFTTKYGSLSDSAFVTQIYQNMFARQPDPSGLAYWTKKLAGGTSRGTVMTNFSESSEGVRVLKRYVNATLLSLGLIHKMPTGTLLTSLMTAGSTDGPEAQAQVLLNSQDFALELD